MISYGKRCDSLSQHCEETFAEKKILYIFIHNITFIALVSVVDGRYSNDQCTDDFVYTNYHRFKADRHHNWNKFHVMTFWTFVQNRHAESQMWNSMQLSKVELTLGFKRRSKGWQMYDLLEWYVSNFICSFFRILSFDVSVFLPFLNLTNFHVLYFT